MIRFRLALFLFLALGGSAQTQEEQRVLPHSIEQIQLSFSPVVEMVTPAVVNIYATQTKDHAASPMAYDPVFRYFFGDDFFAGRSHTRLQKSLGSGVIVRPNGVIITNNHVILNATELKVALNDGREFNVEVISREPRTDLAALKIVTKKNEHFPYLKLHDSDTLKVGDIVLAVGNPYGLGQTVTNGIISALAVTQIGVADFRSFIQTDAAINPGNSGGALVDIKGRLVGINTAILSKTGGSVGIGFAIPSNLVLSVIENVDKGGKIERPWVGIHVKNTAKELVEKAGIHQTPGVTITTIYPGSPAEKAGLKIGDIITFIDTRNINSATTFAFRVASQRAGHVSQFKILRNGKEIEVPVKLELPPEADDSRTLRLTGRHPLSGAAIAALSPALANKIGIDFMEKGVVILKINSGSIARRLGFLPGDIIKKLNDVSIQDVEELMRQLTRIRGGWQITIKRGDYTQTLHFSS